jgi:hypothetical protein
MKSVQWSTETKDTVVKRACVCEGCPHCKHRINVENMYCNTFGEHRCKDCKDYRCTDCMCSTNNKICNYCMRII